MSNPFAKMLSLPGLASALHQLNQAVGNKFAQIESDIKENNSLTDAAYEELNLKVAFLMTIIQAKRPMNSGIAGPDGKVQYEQVSAMEMYLKGGRAMLIEKRDAAQKALDDAQGVPTAQATGGGDHRATASEASADALPAEVTGPKLVTH